MERTAARKEFRIKIPSIGGATEVVFRFDQTHNFVTHFVWELPGQNLSGFAKHIIGGWQTNGILSIRSGFPFNVTQGGDLNTNGSPSVLTELRMANSRIRPGHCGLILRLSGG